MTDDDNTGWSAAKEVFGRGLRHILCRWHVDRAWKNRLKSVKQENQIELYQTLCILESETSEKTFHTRIKQFTERWSSVEPHFISYFCDNYGNRADKWAKCFRMFDHADTDTNMYVESFHNKLKTTYLNGKVNRRV